jgi:hypothetical protein
MASDWAKAMGWGLASASVRVSLLESPLARASVFRSRQASDRVKGMVLH